MTLFYATGLLPHILYGDVFEVDLETKLVTHATARISAEKLGTLE